MRHVMTVALLLTLPLLAGCHTMAGFGTDVKKSGQAIEEKAD